MPGAGATGRPLRRTLGSRPHPSDHPVPGENGRPAGVGRFARHDRPGGGLDAVTVTFYPSRWEWHPLPLPPPVTVAVRPRTVDDGPVRRASIVVVAWVAGAVTLWWAHRVFGLHSPWFAFLLVWVPMACFALVGAAVSARLPAWVFVPRSWERSGRLYEMLGVRAAKRLLRRGPLHVFAPSMRLPARLTPGAVGRLQAHMREAETVHGTQFVLALGLSGYAVLRGWYDVAAWTLLFNVLVNGYPTMLQRYNRRLLAERFPG